jgi:hypothetical protein
VTSRDPFQIYGVNLPIIRLGKSPAQAVEEKSLSQFGQFHRLGQPLRWRHPTKYIDVSASL